MVAPVASKPPQPIEPVIRKPIHTQISEGIWHLASSCIPRNKKVVVIASMSAWYAHRLGQAYLPQYINSICIAKTKEVVGGALGSVLGPLVVVPIVTPFIAPHFSFQIKIAAFVIASLIMNLAMDFFKWLRGNKQAKSEIKGTLSGV